MKLCIKYGKWWCLTVLWFLVLTPCTTEAGSEYSTVSYEQTVAQWKSYQDVANWLKQSFVYDISKLRNKGHGLQSPAETFQRKKGVCDDAANFTIDALNRINPGYKAKAVFIKNRVGPPHHWVAAFIENGHLYIMDYGASMRWAKMNGVHGPYESLADYESFLSSLTMDKFILEHAIYRDF
ncbi:MAG TPA: transglutaminase-like domain-containing protein [Syntrophales bacterium]|nr:transglutaminase-like domain-containing protein [Syntrophales bacterium]